MLYQKLASLACLCASLTSAAVLAPEQFSCGSDNPPESLVEFLRTLQQGENVVSRSRARPLVIDTYFHVVATTAKNGSVSDRMLSQQLSIMNREYAALDVSFNLIDTDFTVNDRWAAGADELGMKQELRRGEYSTLNMYFQTNVDDQGFLGKCFFPLARPSSSQFALDGCLVLADTMPGGATNNYNLGLTAVHEIGHWFGLFHVFQGSSCFGSGDFVSDTPAQRTLSRGCPTGKDSCPLAAGVDSVNNHMDYTVDSCRNEFTPGQEERLFTLWDNFREGI